MICDAFTFFFLFPLLFLVLSNGGCVQQGFTCKHPAMCTPIVSTLEWIFFFFKSCMLLMTMLSKPACWCFPYTCDFMCCHKLPPKVLKWSVLLASLGWRQYWQPRRETHPAARYLLPEQTCTLSPGVYYMTSSG